MITVSLSGVKMFSPVGVYHQELILENEIEVDVSVSYDKDWDELPFVDYEEIHRLIKDVARQPTSLLENIVKSLAKQLEGKYPDSHIEIAIRKLNPPLGTPIRHAEIRWQNKPR